MPVDERESLRNTHFRLETALVALEHWLRDAEIIFEETGGVRGNSLHDERMFLIDSAVAVFAVSAFELYIKSVVYLKTRKWPDRNVSNLKAAKKMLRKSGIALERLIDVRSKHLEFLFGYRHIIIHSGNVPDERFLNLIETLWGPEARAHWNRGAPSFLDPVRVRGLLQNVGECGRLIHNELVTRAGR
jgi:hypothetical protein